MHHALGRLLGAVSSRMGFRLLVAKPQVMIWLELVRGVRKRLTAAL